MREHADDERQFTYTLEQLENAETHDELWNAAQREMDRDGRDAQLCTDAVGQECHCVVAILRDSF
jgi:hypothetical protein